MKTTRLKMPMMVATVAACFLVHAACGQEPAAAGSSGQTEASLAGGTGIHAELNGGLDSKKAKVGDAISLHTTEAVKSKDDRMILPKGTKLVGHITQAEARSKGAGESALGMVFDKAILKDGREVPLNVIIQALGAPVTFSSGADSSPPPDPSSSGTMRTSGMSGPRGGPPSAQVPPSRPGIESPPEADGSSSAPLGPNSRGVLGLSGLTLNTVPANNALVSVLTSDGKNVHLDSGTRFLLVAQGSEAPGR
jgi:hypothetical protein